MTEDGQLGLHLLLDRDSSLTQLEHVCIWQGIKVVDELRDLEPHAPRTSETMGPDAGRVHWRHGVLHSGTAELAG